jgi:hypothetical protein
MRIQSRDAAIFQNPPETQMKIVWKVHQDWRSGRDVVVSANGIVVLKFSEKFNQSRRLR